MRSLPEDDCIYSWIILHASLYMRSAGILVWGPIVTTVASCVAEVQLRTSPVSAVLLSNLLSWISVLVLSTLRDPPSLALLNVNLLPEMEREAPYESLIHPPLIACPC